MRFRLITVFIFTLVILSGFNACTKEPIAVQGNPTEFVANFEKKAEFLHRKLTLCQWDYLTTGKSDSLSVYTSMYSSLVASPQLLKSAQQFLLSTNGEKQKRKLELINAILLKHTLEYATDIQSIKDSLKFQKNRAIYFFEGKQIPAKRIWRVLANDKNRQRRKEAYLSKIEPATVLAGEISRLGRMRNHQAIAFGYRSYYEAMLIADDLTWDELQSLVEKVDEQTRKAYAAILDSLKSSLGVRTLNVWDIDYAFRRAKNQAEPYFPAGKQLKLINATFSGLGMNPDAYPIYFDIVRTDNDLGLSNQLLTVSVPDDFRIALRTSDGYENFRDIVQTTAQALYGCHIDKTDFLFSGPPAPCISSAISVLFSDVVISDTWNRKYAGMPEPLVISLKTVNQFKKLYAVRLTLAQIEFEREFYKDPFADLDAKYDSIFRKYMMLPTPEKSGFWAFNSDLIEKPLNTADRLYGYCIGSQMEAYLYEKYGDLTDNAHLRDYLIYNIFRFGAKENWRSLIKRAIGEEITGQYIISTLTH